MLTLIWVDWRPPIQYLNPFPFASSLPPWSDDSDNGILPPAPEPPKPWGVHSPTSSSASGYTWNSNSSTAREQISHWATKVFDRKHTTTALRARGDPTICYGRSEQPGCLNRLMTENFLQVLRLPLDAASWYAKIYWRPADHRSRLLLSTKDVAGVTLHYCIPLTALKLMRKGPNILLWRLDREEGELRLWAMLNFSVFEPLVLFYCAFTAMKSQDYMECPDVLQDRFHVRDKYDEKEEFSGEIKDDNYLHALRIYRDRDSGAIRLEARARRGKFTATPIWTAFITDLVCARNWIRVVCTKTLQLSWLHPYVFCPGYTPPRGKTGKFRLQFTSSRGRHAYAVLVSLLIRLQDAKAFIDMVNALAAE